MKQIKINSSYSINTDQFFTFRTLLLGIFLTGLLVGLIKGLISAASSNEPIIMPVVFALLGVGAYVYWLYHDFFLKNNTYNKNDGDENKFENYKLEELVIELQTIKDPSLNYVFYKKFITRTIIRYSKITNFEIEESHINKTVISVLNDYFDESYDIKKVKGNISLSEAAELINKDCDKIIYCFLTIAQKYDTYSELDYTRYLSKIILTDAEKKTVKNTLKEVQSIIKKDTNLAQSFMMYTEISDSHIILLTLVTQWLSVEYHAKDKFDIFRVMSFIILPFSGISALFFD